MTVAEFIAKISLDSTKFTEGTNKVKRDVASLKGEIGKFAPALAGAFTVAGLVGLGKKAIETGAHFYDMAQKLGVSTDSIQRLDFAAQQTGVDIDKVARAILKMQGELSHGGWDKDKYASALKSLKLDPDDLIGKSPEQVLIRLADAFSKVKNRAEANAAVVSLVGIKMAGIIPLLSRGAAGLQEMFDRAPVAAEGTIEALKKVKQELDAINRALFPAVSEGTVGVLEKIKGIYKTSILAASMGDWTKNFGTNLKNGMRVVDAARKATDDQATALSEIFDSIDNPLPKADGNKTVRGERKKTPEEERHDTVMKNLDAELRHLLEVNRIAGQAEEKELEERKARLKELDDEYARLEQQPFSFARDEAMKESDKNYVKEVNAIAELEQRMARQRKEEAEAIAKKTQDVEDARFQNSLILMSAEEKRIALLQREQELVQEITKLREGGQAQAATEREKDLESLRAEQLRLDKKGEQPSAGGQPFTVFTNELQRRGGAGAAVVGYGGNEVLNVAKEQLRTQRGIETAIKTMNDRLSQGFNVSGTWT